MQIDPYQSVKIFGWWAQPRLTLAWEDVKHAQLSWRSLRNLGFQPEQLKTLQPDKTEWLQRGMLQLDDIADMTVFPINPLTDFRADLAELWNLKCSSDALLAMGVTHQQLLAKGMNAQIMYYFDFTLAQWSNLGLRRADVEDMQERECVQIFGVEKTELMHIMDEFMSARDVDMALVRR